MEFAAYKTQLVFYKPCTIAAVAVLVVLLNLQASSSSAESIPHPQPFPCFFIFGDSLVDNGNNNQLETQAKANYQPYGVDFPGGSTGRFTDGRTTADILADLLGFESYIPPFATSSERGKEIIKGLNYASGSAGIRSETGQHLGNRISLDRQLQNHNLTVSRITELLGRDDTSEHLGKCLYYFVVGSNDYINNYYAPGSYSTSTRYTTREYATDLVQRYSRQLRALYEFGARKISVSGLGPLGCIPVEVDKPSSTSQELPPTSCADPINDAVQLFNEELKILVDDLNHDLSDAKFVFIRGMSMIPAELLSLGIIFLSQPCCKALNTTGQCVPGQPPCLLRALHAFYDKIHPTEIVNQAVAAAAYLDIVKLMF